MWQTCTRSATLLAVLLLLTLVTPASAQSPLHHGARAASTAGSGQGALPQGRRTHKGRYFGNFNNRYYGPQYGYF